MAVHCYRCVEPVTEHSTALLQVYTSLIAEHVDTLPPFHSYVPLVQRSTVVWSGALQKAKRTVNFVTWESTTVSEVSKQPNETRRACGYGRDVVAHHITLRVIAVFSVVGGVGLEAGDRNPHAGVSCLPVSCLKLWDFEQLDRAAFLQTLSSESRVRPTTTPTYTSVHAFRVPEFWEQHYTRHLQTSSTTKKRR